MVNPKDTAEDAADMLMELDAAAREAVLPYRHTEAVEALAWYSELGDQPQMYALSGGLLALGLVQRDRRMTRAGLRMLAAHWLATATKNFIKRRVDRTRPRSLGEGEGPKLKIGGKTGKEDTSFPSGHSAGATAVARAFQREYPELAVPALVGAGGIALAQIPRCAHYPTDVGAGIAIGAVSEVIVDRLFAWGEEKMPALPFSLEPSSRSAV